MIETAYEPFLGGTVGRYTVTGTSFVWCASPTLCGVFLWGEPTEAETRAILHIFDQYPKHMAPRFDMVLDTRGVQRAEAGGVKLLFSWLLANRKELANHLRMQANVIHEGPIGFLLTGLLPVAGWTLPYRMHFEPAEAFRLVAGQAGDALWAEVEAIAERLRGVSRELRVAREMLAQKLDVTASEVSRALGMSQRSLQRALTRHGTSFHAEVVSARVRRAEALLQSGDEKIAAVASRVGVSERALTLMFRAKLGVSPAEWRNRQR